MGLGQNGRVERGFERRRKKVVVVEKAGKDGEGDGSRHRTLVGEQTRWQVGAEDGTGRILRPTSKVSVRLHVLEIYWLVIKVCAANWAECSAPTVYNYTFHPAVPTPRSLFTTSHPLSPMSSLSFSRPFDCPRVPFDSPFLRSPHNHSRFNAPPPFWRCVATPLTIPTFPRGLQVLAVPANAHSQVSAPSFPLSSSN